jgi:hypothetical protein
LRLAVLLVIALSATACGGNANEERPPGHPTTLLEVEVWPRGIESDSRSYTVDCNSDADPTLQQTVAKSKVCRSLASAPGDVFAPVPDGVACTALYGGPQVARVRGTFRGQPIDARFNRTNGCEITRWDRLRFLFQTRAS